MSTRRPEVFVSATSSDLRSCRQSVKEALLTLGCVPVEQSNFPPDFRSVANMLRKKISSCDAVVHLAGECFGAEPIGRDPLAPRRSYTQMEYDMARELKKPVYVFVCGKDFPYDQHDPEDPEKQEQQRFHREALSRTDTLRYTVHSRNDLELRVRELQTQVELLVTQLQDAEGRVRILRYSLVAMSAVGLAAGMWIARKLLVQDSSIAKLNAELSPHRYAREFADAFRGNAALPRSQNLSPEQKFANAIKEVAATEKISEAEARRVIEQYVASTRANPHADVMDQALASFVQQDFAAAAVQSGKAAEEAKADMLEAEKLLAVTNERIQADKTERRRARILQGQSLYESGDYENASNAFSDALVVTDEVENGDEWARIRARRGLARNEWASESIGAAVSIRRTAALEDLRKALSAQTSPSLAADRAQTLNYLAITLRLQATRSGPSASADLLDEAVADASEALKYYQSESRDIDWALTANNLANALEARSSFPLTSGNLEPLGAAVDYYNSVIQKLSGDSNRRERAIVQKNLAIALSDQARVVDEPTAASLLGRAVTACQSALDAYKANEQTDEWAAAESTMGMLLCAKARAVDGSTRRNLLANAVHDLRLAVDKLAKGKSKQDWAIANCNLGAALGVQSQGFAGTESLLMLTEEEECYNAAKSVFSDCGQLQDLARVESNLAVAQRDKALLSTGNDRRELLESSIANLKAALDVRKKEVLPDEWATTTAEYADSLSERASAAKLKERSDGLAKAGCLYKSVIDYYDTAKRDHNAALVRINFARTLLLESNDAPLGPSAILGDAEVQCRKALMALKAGSPSQEWAKAQNILGLVLQARMATTRDPAPLLKAAIYAHREALKVFSRDTFPDDWATTQIYLGNAFYLEAVTASDKNAEIDYLESAAAADRVALSVFDLDGTPALWSLAAMNLAENLRKLIEIAPENEVVGMVSELVQTERGLLKASELVSDTLPRWSTERDLAFALSLESKRALGEDKGNNLTEAADEYRASIVDLGIGGRNDDRARIQRSLAEDLLELADAQEPESGKVNLLQAITTAKTALDITVDTDDRDELQKIIKSAEDRLRAAAIATKKTP